MLPYFSLCISLLSRRSSISFRDFCSRLAREFRRRIMGIGVTNSIEIILLPLRKNQIFSVYYVSMEDNGNLLGRLLGKDQVFSVYYVRRK
ncbi:unnamed protein product [Cylicocyclus nassatus]|uniref:Uncharacterized protein n=1 Tax=Cylicocyclus nassatus TaxID=53992 RepID=A0AA36MHK4_CYLNA|nr:unnamed protein product [Cylicocyclus nassatus]